jgi:hypothetical protein
VHATATGRTESSSRASPIIESSSLPDSHSLRLLLTDLLMTPRPFISSSCLQSSWGCCRPKRIVVFLTFQNLQGVQAQHPFHLVFLHHQLRIQQAAVQRVTTRVQPRAAWPVTCLLCQPNHVQPELCTPSKSFRTFDDGTARLERSHAMKNLNENLVTL